MFDGNMLNDNRECLQIFSDGAEGDIQLFPDAFSDSADYLFDYFRQSLSWSKPEILVYGKKVEIPRFQAWYADDGVKYQYSGLEMQPTRWDRELLSLKKSAQELTGAGFNSVLANLYRDGNDCVGWHSDDEPELGDDPIIASISFGEERRFVLRHKMNKYKDIDLLLPNGSLLLMGKGVQMSWKHQLPRTKKPKSTRINLSYRFCR